MCIVTLRRKLKYRGAVQNSTLGIPPCFRHNILLDASLTPFLADFGFLVGIPVEFRSSCLVTSAGSLALAGTRGYLAPEFSAGKVGPKCDVYNYGIVSRDLLSVFD